MRSKAGQGDLHRSNQRFYAFFSSKMAIESEKAWKGYRLKNYSINQIKSFRDQLIVNGTLVVAGIFIFQLLAGEVPFTLQFLLTCIHPEVTLDLGSEMV